MSLKKPEYSKQDFIDYLRANADIFQHQPELLELVTLSDDRGTSSLLERQINGLKERLSQFQSAQSQLIEVARENEQISDSFSDIICQLIGFSNLSEFAGGFPSALRKTFQIDEVSFKTTQAVEKRPKENADYQDSLRRLSNNTAVCDNRWPSNIMALFFSDSVKSAALVPLLSDLNGTTKVLGILALGSNDATRYTNELGTAHLNRLSLMAGICLDRLQPSSAPIVD